MNTTIDFEPVIGLEVHAQLSTESKMFCPCSARYFGAAPNSHTCPVCSGTPGSLPVINQAAVDYTVLTALALGCCVPERSKFDRKNYSYPDIPKGYQISQYDMPIGTGGSLQFLSGGQTHTCGIIRVHLEEDTGKSLHVELGGRDVSLVDYNRSGVALMEIVSEPSLRSAEAARDYFAALRQVLMYLNVCDGNLQEGSMRADVNVSVRRSGEVSGTKVEIKNLNSFRAVHRALEYEIERQKSVLTSGGLIAQETRGWSEQREVTIAQRSKEYAHDYRYFPEPDLPMLAISTSDRDRLTGMLPEMPIARVSRFEREYGLGGEAARVLTDDPHLSDFFESALQEEPDLPATTLANWITGEILRLLHASGQTMAEIRVTPRAIARLASLVSQQRVSRTAAKEVLEEMFETGADPDTIVNRDNLGQIVDPDALRDLVERVLSENDNLVEQYRSGKAKVIQALVGRVMKASQGKAKADSVLQILEERLS